MKNKLNLSEHGFFKSQSTTINLVPCLDSKSPRVSFQLPGNSIYFDLSSTSDLV